ncbi:MAG: hypothetical protein KAI91_03370 [Candidatus Omnitrophica bacterium]|nr:hypothetical protein [Candidatus Omnitrophota bacterium]MCK5393351.1 hypothetical protein [Candidatus Omnitrophota bacterium]
MSDEDDKKTNVEQGDKKENVSSKSTVKIVVGVLLILCGVFSLIQWYPDLFALIRGCIGLFLIAAGAIAIVIAKE